MIPVGFFKAATVGGTAIVPADPPANASEANPRWNKNPVTLCGDLNKTPPSSCKPKPLLHSCASCIKGTPDVQNEEEEPEEPERRAKAGSLRTTPLLTSLFSLSLSLSLSLSICLPELLVNKTRNGGENKDPESWDLRTRQETRRKRIRRRSTAAAAGSLGLFVFWAFLGGGGGVECFVELDFLLTTFSGL
jgi:hypothetical protein